MKYGKNSIKYQCITEWNNSLTYFKRNFNNVYGNNHYESFLDGTRNQFKKLIYTLISNT